MEDISLHILDIAENSIRANAKRIEITLSRDKQKDLLLVEIKDNGKGMDQATLTRVRDPFFTTKNKKTGLGLPFLSQAAELAGGSMRIESSPGKGTLVQAEFRLGHIDTPALGDISGTMLTLIAGHPEIEFVYEFREGDDVLRVDTEEIKRELEGVPINNPSVLEAIRGMID